MRTEAITLNRINPAVYYCVVSDASVYASSIVKGSRLLSSSVEFQKFSADDLIWENCVRVDCGRFFISVWRDPTRPELHSTSIVDEQFGCAAVDPDAVPEMRSFQAVDEEAVTELVRRAARSFAKEFLCHPLLAKN